MNLFKIKNNKQENSFLSMSKPKDTILKTGLNTNSNLQTKLKQKSIVKIYVDNNKYYVEHSAAYALGLIKVRAIMMEKPKLVEITSEVHNKLKSNDSIEIEYIKVEKKQHLKVYIDNSQYCIDNSAAYSLGLINVEEFNKSNSDYYYITEEILNDLKQKYDVEFYSLNLEKNSSNKQL